MAYRSKKTSYRSSGKKSSYRKSTYKKPARRASKPREQVVKIVLQHAMMQPTPVPVQGGEGLALPASRAKTSKL